MRRIGFGRCARRGSDPAEHGDLEDIRRVDEDLDALASRESPHSDDAVFRLLGALATDVDDEAPPQPKPAPKRRRLISRAALTTGLTVAALSGTGMAAATVMVGGVGALGPIHQAVEALYDVEAKPSVTASEHVSSSDVRGTIDRTEEAIDEGRVGDAQELLQQARSDWRRVHGPTAGLGNTIEDLEDRLAGEDQSNAGGFSVAAPSASPGAGDPADASASAEEPAGDQPTLSAAGEPRPSPSPSDSPSPSPEPSPTESPAGQDPDGSGNTGGGSSDDTAGTGGGSDPGTSPSPEPEQTSDTGGGSEETAGTGDGDGEGTAGTGGGGSDPATSPSPEPESSSGAGTEPHEAGPDPGPSAAPESGSSPTPADGRTSGDDPRPARDGDSTRSPTAEQETEAPQRHGPGANQPDTVDDRGESVTRELRDSLLPFLAVDDPVDVPSRVLPGDVVLRVRTVGGLVHARSPVVQ